MDVDLQNDLAETLSRSDFSELIQVDFEEDMAVCRPMMRSREEFEHAVNGLADIWVPVAKRYRMRPVQFGTGNYGRYLDDNRTGIRFARIDAEVERIAPDQHAKRIYKS